MSDVYTNAGYGTRPVGFGEKPAILTIDFQLGHTDPRHPLGRSPFIHAALEQTARLVAAARRAGIPIFHTAVAFHPSLQDRPRWKVSTVDAWVLGSEWVQIDPRIYVEGDPVFYKKVPSMFHGTPLNPTLTLLGVDTVIITGCVTSGCVRATTIDAFSYGYRTIVPRDCVGDWEPQAHEQNLTDINRRYADVVSLEEVLAYVDRIAAVRQR